MRPCCYFNLGDQCQNLRPDDYGRCAEWGGKLGPEGTCCADPTVGGVMTCPPDVAGGACWLCESDLSSFPPPQFGSCCFPGLDYQWFEYIAGAQCTSCGNRIENFGVSEEDCEGEPREQECIYADPEDRAPPYENTHRWTLDTAGTVVFGLAKVTQEWEEFRDNFGRPWAQVQGDTYAISTHLTRPRELDTPENACGHAVGGLVMLDDGKCYMATCSQPDVSNLDSHRQSFGMLRTFDTADPQLGVEAGKQYWVTCIRLPAWTEALYRSHQKRCESEPV